MKVAPSFAMGRNTARLSTADYQAVSKAFGVTTSLTKAVVAVEAGGSGFWNSGNLKLLYEGHIAYRETNGDKALQNRLVRAGVAWRRWGDKKYGSATTSRNRLAMALSIAGPRAFRWASYGLPQTMGFNAEMMGYKDAQAMFDAYLDGERNQLDGMFRFIDGAGLLTALKSKDWRKFAKGYNGPSFATHNYHGRLEAAYNRFAKRKSTNPLDDGVLRQGEIGQAVADLQADLNLLFNADLEMDGVFGRGTFQSVHYAQGQLGLVQDGVAGPATLGAIKAMKDSPAAAPVEPVDRAPIDEVIDKIAAHDRVSKTQAVSGLGGAAATIGTVKTIADDASGILGGIADFVPDWFIPAALIAVAGFFAFTWWDRRKYKQMARDAKVSS